LWGGRESKQEFTRGRIRKLLERRPRDDVAKDRKKQGGGLIEEKGSANERKTTTEE